MGSRARRAAGASPAEAGAPPALLSPHARGSPGLLPGREIPVAAARPVPDSPCLGGLAAPVSHLPSAPRSATRRNPPFLLLFLLRVVVVVGGAPASKWLAGQKAHQPASGRRRTFVPGFCQLTNVFVQLHEANTVARYLRACDYRHDVQCRDTLPPFISSAPFPGCEPTDPHYKQPPLAIRVATTATRRGALRATAIAIAQARARCSGA